MNKQKRRSGEAHRNRQRTNPHQRGPVENDLAANASKQGVPSAFQAGDNNVNQMSEASHNLAGYKMGKDNGFSQQQYALAFESVRDSYLLGLQVGKMIADLLDSWGAQAPDGVPCPVPVWFVYDLSIAILLSCWEKIGVLDILPEKFPNSNAIVDRIAADCRNPETYTNNQPDHRLGMRVLATHRLYFAKSQITGHLNRFHLDNPDSEELIESLAQFLVNSSYGNEGEQNYAKT